MQNIIPISVATIDNSNNRTCNELMARYSGARRSILHLYMIRLFFLSRQFSRKNLYLKEDRKGRFLSTKSDRQPLSTLTHDIFLA